MRLIFALNVALFVIALSLGFIDWRLDRSSLLGSGVDEKALLGRNMEELLDGQPVEPDTIVILSGGDLIALVYEQDTDGWHQYPSVEVTIVNERVVGANVRRVP